MSLQRPLFKATRAIAARAMSSQAQPKKLWGGRFTVSKVVSTVWKWTKHCQQSDPSRCRHAYLVHEDRRAEQTRDSPGSPTEGSNRSPHGAI